MGSKYHHKRRAQTENCEEFQMQEIQNLSSDLELWRPWEAEHNEAAKKRPRCADCPREFNRESELKRHQKSVHKKSQEKCPLCIKRFTRKDNLTRHLKNKHQPSSKPTCQYCNKILSRLDAVQRHITTCPSNPLKKSIYFHTYSDLADRCKSNKEN